MLAFYELSDFNGVRYDEIHRSIDQERVRFIGNDNVAMSVFNVLFDQVGVSRFGVLKGEYLLSRDALIMVDRNERFIMINCTWEDFASKTIIEYSVDDGIRSSVRNAIKHIDMLVTINSPLIIGNPYSNNYFHFLLDSVSISRFFPSDKYSAVIVSEKASNEVYQKNILLDVFKGKNIIVQTSMIRVIDPLLAHTQISEGAIIWLRQTITARARKGNRKIYIKRVSMTRSMGKGSLYESEAFSKFLSDNDFECVDFGRGEMSVSQQISMLDGADLIISTHGANMTNIIFLTPGINVIEIFGPNTIWGGYAYISSVIGLNYRALFSNVCDSNGAIYMDTSKIIQAMESLSIPTAPLPPPQSD